MYQNQKQIYFRNYAMIMGCMHLRLQKIYNFPLKFEHSFSHKFSASNWISFVTGWKVLWLNHPFYWFSNLLTNVEM